MFGGCGEEVREVMLDGCLGVREGIYIPGCEQCCMKSWIDLPFWSLRRNRIYIPFVNSRLAREPAPHVYKSHRTHCNTQLYHSFKQASRQVTTFHFIHPALLC